VIDEDLIEMRDLGVNFFLQEDDIGKKRSSVVANKLKDLNPLCNVTIATSLDEHIISKHTALVITQILNISELLKWNEYCRQQYNNISFFYAFTSGISLDLFVDHGMKHIVNDFNGERPIQKLITDIHPISDGETIIRYETPEGQQPVSLNNGYFEITEVNGVDSINNNVYLINRDDKDPVKTIRIPYCFPASYKYLSGIITFKLLCCSQVIYIYHEISKFYVVVIRLKVNVLKMFVIFITLYMYIYVYISLLLYILL
jgi:hypothetical protein